MGWAAGFQAGSQVARNALDAYYTAKERKEIEDLNQQTPEDLGYKLSPEQKQYIQGIQNAKDAEGNPQFQFTERQEPGRVGLSISDPRGVYAAQLGQETYSPAAMGGSYAGTASGRYTPIPGSELNVAAQQRVRYLGREYGATELTPEAQRTARTQALADIVSKYRPEAGARLGMESQRALMEGQRAAREAEQADYLKSRRGVGEEKDQLALDAARLGLDVSKQGLAKAKLEVATAERAEQDIKNLDDFYKEYTLQQATAKEEGRSFSNKDAAAMLRSSGLRPELQFKVLGNLTQFREQQLKANAADLKQAVQDNATLPKLVNWFNKSDTLLPGQQYTAETDKKTGAVSLTLVDKDGTVVEPTKTYKNSNDAFGYLAARAQDPITAVAYSQGLEAKALEERKIESGLNRDAAAIKASEAESRLRDAQATALPEEAKLRRAQVDYYREMKAQAGKQKPIYRDFTATDGTPMLLDITALPVRNGQVQLPPNVVAGKSELTARETIAYKEFLKLSKENPDMTDQESDALIRRYGLDKVIPLSTTSQNMPGAFGDKAAKPGGAAPAAGLNRPSVPAYSNTSLPITDRITAAVNADRSAGNNYEVGRLREEASTVVPQIRSQIATLKNSMNQGTPQQKASMEARIAELEKSLTAYSGLLPQPTGLR